MGLARDLVQLEQVLRDSRGVDPFLPLDQSGMLSSAELVPLLPRVPFGATDQPAAIVQLCLQALRIQGEELRHTLVEAELVATLPPGLPGIARPTALVAREMIEGANQEVILLGYELSDSDLIRLLVAAVGRGVDTILICDRGRGSAKRVADMWPDGVRTPRVYHDRERHDGAPYASMHAKCLLVDGDDLLVTSANFTFHGLHGNIEIGVRLAGPPATEARKVFSHLVESRIVEEYG